MKTELISVNMTLFAWPTISLIAPFIILLLIVKLKNGKIIIRNNWLSNKLFPKKVPKDLCEVFQEIFGVTVSVVFIFFMVLLPATETINIFYELFIAPSWDEVVWRMKILLIVTALCVVIWFIFLIFLKLVLPGFEKIGKFLHKKFCLPVSH